MQSRGTAEPYPVAAVLPVRWSDPGAGERSPGASSGGGGSRLARTTHGSSTRGSTRASNGSLRASQSSADTRSSYNADSAPTTAGSRGLAVATSRSRGSASPGGSGSGTDSHEDTSQSGNAAEPALPHLPPSLQGRAASRGFRFPGWRSSGSGAAGGVGMRPHAPARNLRALVAVRAAWRAAAGNWSPGSRSPSHESGSGSGSGGSSGATSPGQEHGPGATMVGGSTPVAGSSPSSSARTSANGSSVGTSASGGVPVVPAPGDAFGGWLDTSGAPESPRASAAAASVPMAPGASGLAAGQRPPSPPTALAPALPTEALLVTADDGYGHEFLTAEELPLVTALDTLPHSSSSSSDDERQAGLAPGQQQQPFMYRRSENGSTHGSPVAMAGRPPSPAQGGGVEDSSGSTPRRGPLGFRRMSSPRVHPSPSNSPGSSPGSSRVPSPDGVYNPRVAARAAAVAAAAAAGGLAPPTAAATAPDGSASPAGALSRLSNLLLARSRPASPSDGPGGVGLFGLPMPPTVPLKQRSLKRQASKKAAQQQQAQQQQQDEDRVVFMGMERQEARPPMYNNPLAQQQQHPDPIFSEDLAADQILPGAAPGDPSGRRTITANTPGIPTDLDQPATPKPRASSSKPSHAGYRNPWPGLHELRRATSGKEEKPPPVLPGEIEQEVEEVVRASQAARRREAVPQGWQVVEGPHAKQPQPQARQNPQSCPGSSPGSSAVTTGESAGEGASVPTGAAAMAAMAVAEIARFRLPYPSAQPGAREDPDSTSNTLTGSGGLGTGVARAPGGRVSRSGSGTLAPPAPPRPPRPSRSNSQQSRARGAMVVDDVAVGSAPGVAGAALLVRVRWRQPSGRLADAAYGAWVPVDSLPDGEALRAFMQTPRWRQFAQSPQYVAFARDNRDRVPRLVTIEEGEEAAALLSGVMPHAQQQQQQQLASGTGQGYSLSGASRQGSERQSGSGDSGTPGRGSRAGSGVL